MIISNLLLKQHGNGRRKYSFFMKNIRDKIESKKLDILFSKSLISNTAVILGSLLVVLVLWNYIKNKNLITVWLVLMIVLAVIRVFYVFKLKNKNQKLLRKYYLIVTTLLGIGWAVIPLFPYKQFMFFPIIANVFIMFTLITLGIQALFYDKTILVTYITPMPLTLAYKVIISGESNGVFIAIAIFFFLSILFFYAFKQHNDFVKLLQLQIENENLLEKEKEAKLKAEESSKAKSQFLATISHEIRTPMNAILGFIDILYNTEDRDKQKEYLDIIKSSSNNLLSILNDILDISKIESEDLAFEERPFNLMHVIENTIESFHEASSKKKLILEHSIDKKLNKYYIGDPSKIQQVISNLLDNAIKFTEKGKIGIKANVLSLKNNIETVEIIIYDTGIGIAENMYEKIFEPFTQVDSSVTRKFGGTGVGLAIVDKIVKHYNGTIEIESTLGSGSKFIIKLPLQVAKEDEFPLEDYSDYNKFFFKDVKVLVAEDNEVNQILIKKILENLKIDVKIAENGRIALDYIAEDDFDLIFLDWHMPEMDGVKVAEILREIEKNGNIKPNLPKNLIKLKQKHIPLIILTAATLNDEVNFLKEKGFDGYLFKPIDKELLIKILLQFIPEEKVIVRDRKVEFDHEYLKELTGNNTDIINKLIESFKNTFFELTTKLEKKVKEEDFDEIKKLANALKGAAASIKLMDIYNICKNIERAANKKEILPIKQGVKKLLEIEFI